ncbi:unnamed protein product [Ceratitis capitata]|uniref:(Mediterranean fruit fly) hypothetical protein n=1 Tax=Ceratitis capitata TaxID=7213 RepID=A0A811VG99_CERCA|nr:unnamed protein product [Ceratitis capitata]
MSAICSQSTRANQNRNQRRVYFGKKKDVYSQDRTVLARRPDRTLTAKAKSEKRKFIAVTTQRKQGNKKNFAGTCRNAAVLCPRFDLSSLYVAVYVRKQFTSATRRRVIRGIRI